MDLTDLAAQAKTDDEAAKAAERRRQQNLDIANNKTDLVTMVRDILDLKVDPDDLVKLDPVRSSAWWALPIDGDTDTATMGLVCSRQFVSFNGPGRTAVHEDMLIVVHLYGPAGRCSYPDKEHQATSMAALGKEIEKQAVWAAKFHNTERAAAENRPAAAAKDAERGQT